MEDWIDRLAAELGEEPLSREDVTQLLGVARDVAHQVERKVTPVATFLLGCAAGRSIAEGGRRSDATSRAVQILQATLPPMEEPEAPKSVR